MLRLKRSGPTNLIRCILCIKNFRFFCESSSVSEGSLRDTKDIPVLIDALFHQVDVILSGDKDFLEADLEYPLVFSPATMLDFLEKKNR